MRRFMVGQVYDSGGEGTWRVQAVLAGRLCVSAEHGPAWTASGPTVVLWNEAIGCALAAPETDPSLGAMKLIGETA